MFKKVLATMGVGSAEVDLILQKQDYEPGETLKGEFFIKGGTVEQKINNIAVALAMKANINDRPASRKMATIPVVSSFAIQPNEQKTFPFSYELPEQLPISSPFVAYGIATRLDIAGGRDHRDYDRIRILPPWQFIKIKKALESIGFQEKSSSGKLHSFGQQFEYAPTAATFGNRIHELEWTAAIEKNGVWLFLEVDAAALPFGLAERELKHELFLKNEQLKDVSTLSDQLQKTIETMLENPRAYRSSHTRRKHPEATIGHFAAGLFGGLLLGEALDADDALEGDLDIGDGLDFDFGDFGDFGDF